MEIRRKIVIIGGVAGGATAAARLRRLNEKDEIIIFEKDEYISFANCGLPYYIGGVIEEREKLLVQSIEGMSKRFNLDIRNFSEVIAIDPIAKKVTVLNHQTKEVYDETYNILVLSPGAKPIWPSLPGIDQAHVFKVRNIPDTDAIFDFIATQQPKTAVVVGGGFIGIEMAEALVERGLQVTIVDKNNQVLRPFDMEMAAIIENELIDHGVVQHLQDGVESIVANQVILTSGQVIDAQLVIMAIGVVPETKLAQMANLKLGVTGAIEVNEQLQTSNSSIYAIGDAIEVKHYISGQATKIPLAWPANRQGRLVADHINGYNVRYSGTLGTSVVKAFTLTAAVTGLNEEALKVQNIPYKAIHIHRANHASYYPGANIITLKLLFQSETGAILGAQAVGGDGTEKRIDVISTAIKGKLTIFDLSDLELAYAPPFSSAKDPVNIAGYVATNVYDGENVIHWHQVDNLLADKGCFIDVRTPNEYSQGSISTAINVPLDDLREFVQTTDVCKEMPVYIFCQVGLRGHAAVSILKDAGFTQVFNLSGGYKTYSTVSTKQKQEQKEVFPCML
ncbi:MAG: CoA-disulfide reductase [Culicoidibacterales bacterium]